jgi:transcriptional regulator with XRE-family HTH domain
VGEEVRRTRDRKGWSQQQLADMLEDLGADWFDRSTIAKIETGARNVSLEDCIALAVALDVPPSALFLPRENAEVALLPGVVVQSHRAAKWAKGILPLTYDDPVADPESRFFYEQVTDHEWRGRQIVPVARLLKFVAIAENSAANRDFVTAAGALVALQREAKYGIDSIKTEMEITDGS